jgi:hypothetical protein
LGRKACRLTHLDAGTSSAAPPAQRRVTGPGSARQRPTQLHPTERLTCFVVTTPSIGAEIRPAHRGLLECRDLRQQSAGTGGNAAGRWLDLPEWRLARPQ